MTEVLTIEEQDPNAVTEVQAADLRITNPQLTVEVRISSLDTYTVTGLRANVMKTARNWIRQRGLTVTMPGTLINETDNAGNPVNVDGIDVPSALKVYTFTEEAILAAGVTVTLPTVREPKAPKEPKSDKSGGKAGKSGGKAGKSGGKVDLVAAVDPTVPVQLEIPTDAIDNGDDVAPRDW